MSKETVLFELIGQYLGDAIRTLEDVQGEWLGIEAVHCPENVGEIKKAIQDIEDTQELLEKLEAGGCGNCIKENE